MLTAVPASTLTENVTPNRPVRCSAKVFKVWIPGAGIYRFKIRRRRHHGKDFIEVYDVQIGTAFHGWLDVENPRERARVLATCEGMVEHMARAWKRRGSSNRKPPEGRAHG